MKFFKAHLGMEPTYLSIISFDEKTHSILHAQNAGFQIEMLNYDSCGILLDVQEGKALREEPEYPLEYVRPMHACIEKCLELLPAYSLQTFDKAVIEWAVQAMQFKLEISQHIVHQVIPPNTTSVRSFDLFDTLLGRFHYRPDSIFALVERLYPFPGFTFYRMAAECKSDRTLADTYRELQKMTGIEESEAAALMQFEFETEKKHIFPIVENLAQVKDGDLIVSDTYYNTEQIREILDVIQLDRKVHIYASPRGKSSGHGWSFLKRNYKIENHLGDSFHSDVAMANLQNIEAIHYTNGWLSPEEEHLFQLGHEPLSFLCRALRLSNPHVLNSLEWCAWNHQCKPRHIVYELLGECREKYLEFLPFYEIQPLDASVIESLNAKFTHQDESFVANVSRQSQVEWINRDRSYAKEPLHSGELRDIAHWTNEEEHLFNMGQPELSALCRDLRLANPYVPNEPDWFLWNDQCKLNVPILIHASLYLHEYCQTHKKKRILFTSRDCCLWIQVFRQLFPGYDSIYFHASRHTYLSASASYIAYVQSLYTDESVIVDGQGTGLTCEKFFAEHMGLKPTYLAIISTESHAILQQHASFFEGGIEMLNYDTCGTLYDVQDHKPLRCDPEYPLKYIVPMHKCIEKCLELLPSYRFRTLDLAVIEWAVKSIESDLAISRYIVHAKAHCHIANETGIQHLHIARPKLLL